MTNTELRTSNDASLVVVGSINLDMVGAVGEDAHGKRLADQLSASGVLVKVDHVSLGNAQRDFRASVRLSMRAAAITFERLGAQEAIPTRRQVLARSD